MTKLIDFLNHLEEASIYYKLDKCNDEYIMVEVSVPENAGKLSLLIMMLELKNSGVMEIFTIKMNLKIYFNNFQISRVV